MKPGMICLLTGWLIVSACLADGIPKTDSVTVDIQMPAIYFGAGDEFWLHIETRSLSGNPIDCRLFVILRIYDSFFMYPSWRASYPPGYNADWADVIIDDEIRVILDTVTFPDDWTIVIDDLQFATACASPSWELISNIDRVDWSVGP
ncbi:hypothetical protein JXA80_13805 [bacterium]|nr:hypothetical protein [candidate division CSSED10-310 bacterium]